MTGVAGCDQEDTESPERKQAVSRTIKIVTLIDFVSFLKAIAFLSVRGLTHFFLPPHCKYSTLISKRPVSALALAGPYICGRGPRNLRHRVERDPCPSGTVPPCRLFFPFRTDDNSPYSDPCDDGAQTAINEGGLFVSQLMTALYHIGMIAFSRAPYSTKFATR